MQLDVAGHPLHTRALSIVLAQGVDGRLDVHGTILDLRKRGFVPIAGDLQSSGIIHQMTLDGVIDPATATLESLTATQPHVAFEPSPATGGESCRDPIGRIAALVGARLDAGFAKRIGAEIGGPRGCSHILTLAQLLGSTAAWALERDRLLHGAPAARRAGERVFRRDVVVDGHEPVAGELALAAQLTELSFAPAPALTVPMDRFAAQVEVRVLAEARMAEGAALTRVAAAERRRTLGDLETAAWRDRTDQVAELAGLRLTQGITGELLRRFGAAAADRPLLDTLLMLAPAMIQCAAAMSEGWAVAAKRDRWLVGPGGYPDSCYMWRQGGALDRARDLPFGPPGAAARTPSGRRPA